MLYYLQLKGNVTSSQLNTNTWRPSRDPSALTDSVLPVPAGPYGLPPSPIRKAFIDHLRRHFRILVYMYLNQNKPVSK